MTGYVFVVGDCFVCGRTFTFNMDLVPSIYIDLDTGLPPDMGGDPGRAARQPICGQCVVKVNRTRSENGREPIPVLPGAYEPTELDT